MHWLWALLVSVVLACSGEALVFYVGHEDGLPSLPCGNYSAPCQDIANALQQTQSGDLVLIERSTVIYPLHAAVKVLRNQSVSIRSYHRNEHASRAVFRCTGAHRGFEVLAPNITLQGIEVGSCVAPQSVLPDYGSALGGNINVALDLTPLRTGFYFLIQDCKFVDGTGLDVNSGGGGMAIVMNGARNRYSALANITIERTVFSGSSCNVSGGALLVQSDFANLQVSLQINDCLFTNNSAYRGTGGGLQVEMYSVMSPSLDISIKNSAFIGNQAGSVAADIAWEWDGDGLVNTTHVTIEDCVFTHESDRISLGSIGPSMSSAASTMLVDVSRCSFSGYSQTYGGGGVLSFFIFDYKFPLLLTMQDCNFTNNQATDGGAVYVHSNQRVSIDMIRCNFFNNSAQFSGGVVTATLSEPPEIPNQYFYSPVTRSPYKTYDFGHTYINIQDCVFAHNFAKLASGGAIVMTNGNLTISGSRFINNSSPIFGGGVYMNGITTLSMTRTNFEQNNAVQRGTDLYSSSPAKHTVSKCVFTGTEGVAVDIVSGGYVDIDPDSQFLCPTGCEAEKLDISAVINRKYTLTTFRLTCSPCAPRSYSFARGFLQGKDIVDNPACLDCPIGGRCLGGAKVQSLDNYYGGVETNPMRVQFLACPRGYCQPALSPTFADACNNHRRGLLCGTCQPGFSQALGSPICVENGKCHDAWWLLVVLVLFSVGFILYLSIFDLVNDGVMKILIAYFQVIALCIDTVSPISIFVEFFHFQISSSSKRPLCPLPDISTATSIAFQFLSPAVLFFILGSIAVLKRWLGLVPARLSLMSRTFDLCLSTATVRLLFFTYTSFVRPTFTLLNCVTVPGAPGLYVYEAGDIKCYTPWQRFLVVCLTLLVLSPICVFFFLRRHRRRRLAGVAMAAENDGFSHRAYMVLVASYQSGYWYWDIVLIMQLLLFNFLRAFFSASSTQGLAYCLLAAIFLLMQLHCSPFQTQFTNLAQSALLSFVLLFNLTLLPVRTLTEIAATQRQESSLYNLEWLRLLLICLPAVLPFVYVLYKQYYRPRYGEHIVITSGEESTVAYKSLEDNTTGLGSS